MATDKDMDKAHATYDRFMATLKWSIPLVLVAVFLVVWLLAS